MGEKPAALSAVEINCLNNVIQSINLRQLDKNKDPMFPHRLNLFICCIFVDSEDKTLSVF